MVWARQETVGRVCLRCERQFTATVSDLARNRGKYCSRSCTGRSSRNGKATKLQQFLAEMVGREGCWELPSAAAGEYGQATVDGEKDWAHRLAYATTHGPVPRGKCVMHTCDNPPCVNPAHLTVGTIADNNADCKAKGRTVLGEKNWNAKLTEEAVWQIRADTRLQKVIAADYGVSVSLICMIKTRRVWSHVGS